MITSKNNQQMKYIRSLQKKSKLRYEEQVFVVEGIKMCLEAPEKWVAGIYVSDSFLMEAKHRELLSAKQYEVVADEVFQSISDTMTPQGILALVKMPGCQIEDLFKRSKPRLLILEGIQDPGNLGTMVRTGEGAGISGVIVNDTTVDLFHPKTIRATMGSVYRVPVFRTGNLWDTLSQLKARGISIYAAHLQGSIAYDRIQYAEAAGILIGNEGSGLSEEIAAGADFTVHIPMEGQVESLNAALAAGILMYEVHRQRGSA